VYVQGVIDLLTVDANRALVLDYKTDREASADELRKRYGRQLGWYCRAVSALLPGKAVYWAIYGLGGAGLVGPVEWKQP
jgi:ATP-dependent helicase/nuclease subunit A